MSRVGKLILVKRKGKSEGIRKVNLVMNNSVRKLQSFRKGRGSRSLKTARKIRRNPKGNLGMNNFVGRLQKSRLERRIIKRKLYCRGEI